MAKQNERNAGRPLSFGTKGIYITFRVPEIHKQEIKEKVYKILDEYKNK